MICDQCGKETSETWNRDFLLNKPFSKQGNIMICKECALKINEENSVLYGEAENDKAE